MTDEKMQGNIIKNFLKNIEKCLHSAKTCYIIKRAVT